jgi:hypothetical protein
MSLVKLDEANQQLQSSDHVHVVSSAVKWLARLHTVVGEIADEPPKYQF